MKITGRKNFKGQELKEWELKEETPDYFFLKDSEGHILNYPKANFENEMQHAGASREGNTFFIPQKRDVKN